MANLVINADQWNALSGGDREEIRRQLIEANAIRREDVIVGDPGVPRFDPSAPVQRRSVPRGACETACEVAAAAGRAFCATLPWPKKAVGLALVAAGLRLCKAACG